MGPADHHRDAQAPVAPGQLVGLVDLRRVAGDAHQVETDRCTIPHGQVGHLDVGDLVLLGRHPGQGEQAEAGQGGDGLAPFHEPRQGEAELEQLGVTDPDAAHGDEADSHRLISRRKRARAMVTEPAGMKKMCLKKGFQALR